MKKSRVKIGSLKNINLDNNICVKGWVRTKRQGKNVTFISLNDGSTINSLQVVLDMQKFKIELIEKINTGSSVEFSGNLIKSQGKIQNYELDATEFVLLGESDVGKYPIQPKKHSLEFLRDVAHLRPRTNTFSAIFRIRHAVIFSIHKFFNDKGFVNIHTPIITSSDTEGAGEMFRVTSLDLDNIKNNKVDFNKDFFSKEVNLTVSGQLNAELGALALSEVYTFGPTFRAENSNTSRHLAEFWMVEPEIAFYDIIDNMNLAEDILKYIISYVIKNCFDDLEFLQNREIDDEKNLPQIQRNEKPLIERLKKILNTAFERITYTEAFNILRNSKPNKKGKFKYKADEWGMDFQSEHERFLVEKHFKKPVIVIDYPKNIKAFYMRVNDDNSTVSAMDVLFPSVGEIIGGSQREERLSVLKERMNEMNLSEKDLNWYLDTRRFGTVVHSGFGLGLERLMQFITGMKNIRDVIPFPRTPGNCNY
ncbi:MAG TPA: asparagine--tRNA ligase [Cytophagales bacterium]|jgi:asparaginyl-tRNA synthetase|nr:asparagine--tRNA ligase [Cytophagales bacterium]